MRFSQSHLSSIHRRSAAVRSHWQVRAIAGLLLAAGFFFACDTNGWGEDWPQWRGPHYNGTTTERNLPLAWSEERGLAWKLPIEGEGNSTPAIVGQRAFLTSVREEDLLVHCVDLTQGKVLWTRTVGSAATPRGGAKRGEHRFHRWNNLAAPSPVANDQYVVVHFGNGDLAAYNHAGKQLWKRNLQDDHGRYVVWWGHANSPVLYKDLVISVCMQDRLDGTENEPAKSYLVAHDLATGRMRWLTDRTTEATAEECDSYTTPLLYEGKRGAEVIVMGGNLLDGYDPDTGAQRWKSPPLTGGRTVASPVLDEDRVYAVRGMRGPIAAVDILDAEGTLDRRSILWQQRSGTPDTCTPVVDRGRLFCVTDDGIARCLDLRAGAVQWTLRLPGEYKASPLAADDRIYFLNVEGVCTVVSSSDRLHKLTENKLDDRTLASPAVSGGRIYIRGQKRLYCISK